MFSFIYIVFRNAVSEMDTLFDSIVLTTHGCIINILTSKRNASTKMLHNLVNKYSACAKQGYYLIFVSISRDCIQKIWFRIPFLSKIFQDTDFFCRKISLKH